jgi:hypothetical protein
LDGRDRLVRCVEATEGGDHGDDDAAAEQRRDEGNEEAAFHFGE